MGAYMLKGTVLVVLAGVFVAYRLGYEMDLTAACLHDLTHEWLWTMNQAVDSDPNLIVLLIGQ